MLLLTVMCSSYQVLEFALGILSYHVGNTFRCSFMKHTKIIISFKENSIKYVRNTIRTHFYHQQICHVYHREKSIKNYFYFYFSSCKTSSIASYLTLLKINNSINIFAFFKIIFLLLFFNAIFLKFYIKFNELLN